ncbi:MAG: hypothetical protein SFX72_04010 [Isosphaeraceae bacterium]|nr:hypothetical protein [Isosphaeraceae bacterium]
MIMTVIYYFFLKIVLFFGIVKSLSQFDFLHKYLLLLSGFYTAAVALLSWIFIFGWQQKQWPSWQVAIAERIGVTPWQSWVGQTFLISSLYFWLMVKFEETSFFWVLLIFGVVVVAY